MTSKILKSIICGRELKIQKILEKYKAVEKDIDIVLDEIANIEKDTIELFKITHDEKNYLKSYGYRMSKKKVSSYGKDKD